MLFVNDSDCRLVQFGRGGARDAISQFGVDEGATLIEMVTAPNLSLLKRNYRVALVSSGICHVQRGFETFIADLALALDGCSNVHLFQGSGGTRSPKVTTLPTLQRNSWAIQRFGPTLEDKRYRFEQLSFVFSGWILGHWPKYDLIYYCDADIGDALYYLKKKFGYVYRLLYGNCSPTSPGYREQRCDYIQQFTSILLEQAIETGIPRAKMTLLPMGINVKQFETTLCRKTIREKYRIPTDKFAILCVSSLDDRFKRLQWLIETIAEMRDPNLYLLLVGQNEKTSYALKTLSLADSCLRGRYQHLMLPHSRIAEIYKASDLFVHPALREGFGKVYLEAAASRIPVLCHDSTHTLWLMAHEFSRVDMENRKLLQAHIYELEANLVLREQMTRRNYSHVVTHFDWKNLKDKYLEMFETALA
jgi:1,2-diacylglycerol 3-alpha-glucosyltransferase